MPFIHHETCDACGCWSDDVIPHVCADAMLRRATILATSVLVGGRRREILPCECGASMIAGIDHTCDIADRLERGLSVD